MNDIDEFLFQALQSGLLVYDDKIKAQYDFVMDKSKYLAAFTTRRAGKSTALAHRFMRTMLKHPNCFCPYIALTRDSAKNTMWSILQQETTRYSIEASFTEHNLTMTLKNGSRLQLFGAEMKNFIERLKGIKTPGAAIDEAQGFKSHIESLIDDVLAPATVDYKDSWIAITGTPGPVPQGFFYDITAKKKHGYSVHSWSLFDNPYIPDPQGLVKDLIKRKGWTTDSPTLLREYYGQWVLDIDVLIIKYNELVNNYASLPSSKLNYIMGIDLGFNDADAIAILGWSESSSDTYLVEELVMDKQGITELVQQIEHLRLKYDVYKMVIDTGGLGKKIAEELIKQHKIPVQAADKSRKMENIAFLNDALRVGKFKAKKDSRFAQDSYLVQLDKDKTTPDKIVVKDSFHSDIIDAVLYAFKESPAYAYEKAIAAPEYLSLEWANAEVIRMEEEAEEYFKKQEEDLSLEDDFYLR